MENHAEAGRLAYKSGNYAEASRHLEHVLSADPQDSALRLMLARSYEQQHRFDDARKHLRMVVKHPDSLDHRKLAGLALVALEVRADELMHSLSRAGTLSDQDLSRAQRDRRPDETVLASLLRQSSVRFSDLVASQFGPSGLPSHTERPYPERLGMRLVAAGLISQVQLKQALKNQPITAVALGQQLSETQGVSQQAINEHVSKQADLCPQLAHSDQLANLLVRWGVIVPQDWQRAAKSGGNPAQALIKQGSCQPEHLHRARHYQQLVLTALQNREFRLGEVLIDLGIIERTDLGIALACQVDQPTPLGELLIAQRHASPEAVLTGLLEQHRRYVEEAEAQLEPLSPKNLPATAPPIPELAVRPPWQIWGGTALGLLVLTFASWYGLRYANNRYAWLQQAPTGILFGSRAAHQTSGDVVGREGAQRKAPMVSGQFDPMSLPDANAPAGMDVGYDAAGSPSAYAAGSWKSERQGSASFPGAPAGWNSEAGAMTGTAPVPLKHGETATGTVNGMTAAPFTPGKVAANGKEAAPVSSASVWDAPLKKVDDWQGRLTRTLDGAQADLSAGNPQAQTGEVKGRPAKTQIDAKSVDHSTTVFRYRLGQAQFERENYQSAWVEFRAALAAEPTSPLPLYYLGRISEQQGNRLEALHYYHDYLQKMPNGEFDGEVRQRISGLQP